MCNRTTYRDVVEGERSALRRSQPILVRPGAIRSHAKFYGNGLWHPWQLDTDRKRKVFWPAHCPGVTRYFHEVAIAARIYVHMRVIEPSFGFVLELIAQRNRTTRISELLLDANIPRVTIALAGLIAKRI